MKCVLVTGAAGFIGSHLSEALVKRGYQVYGVDNLQTGRLSNLKNLENERHFKFINLDVNEILENSDLQKINFFGILHLAALADIVPSIEHPNKYFNSNVAGTLKVVEFVRALKIPRLVYAASSSCYGIAEDYPTSEKSRIQLEYPYALTKYMGEEIILHWSKVYGFSATSLRLFNVFGLRSRTSGSYGAVFGVFLAQKLAGKPLTIVGDGSQSRDFTHVSDVVNAFVSSLEVETSENTRIYNVGSGRTQTVSYLAKLIGGPTVPLPKRPGEPDITFADITKIRAELGWNPHQKFEDGVLELLENIDQFKDAPVWDVKSIERATDVWFKRLSKES